MLQWLKHTLQNIITIHHKNMRDLYPQNYMKLIEAAKAWLVGRMPRSMIHFLVLGNDRVVS
ncbi:hypothetical protein FVR03_05080 [Pontibacter qinzhouensis]|uniref:Uncharacterized protein n=1 Tax=Pontibacter qinzhouensis TaxID=2603253 RepID=A0A5C8KD74_9BACT|nr:hypothetical protein FVR03_05080 [Pontibacter qinzhouensis]